MENVSICREGGNPSFIGTEVPVLRTLRASPYVSLHLVVHLHPLYSSVMVNCFEMWQENLWFQSNQKVAVDNLGTQYLWLASEERQSYGTKPLTCGSAVSVRTELNYKTPSRCHWKTDMNCCGVKTHISGVRSEVPRTGLEKSSFHWFNWQCF